MKRLLIVFFVWLLSASSALAEEIKRVAILEFRGVGIEQSILLKLSDQSRLAAVQMLPKDQYSVMTRENMMMILDDMGKDASCMEGSCEVEIGRNIGADFVVTGDIMKVENDYMLTLKLHDTRSGELLAGEEVAKDQVLDLVNETRAMSAQLYSKGFGIVVEGDKKKSAGLSHKTLYWIGHGFLAASGTTAAVAYQTQQTVTNDYINGSNTDVDKASQLKAMNAATGAVTPILFGISATSYTLGFLKAKKSKSKSKGKAKDKADKKEK